MDEDYYELDKVLLVYDYDNETLCMDGGRCTENFLVALVFFAIVFFVGVSGNSLIVWVTAFQMPRSVNTLWFLNLAIANLLCCLSLPLIMVPLAQDTFLPFGLAACKLLLGLLYMLMYCSVLLLVFISLDRWLLVSHSTWCHKWRNPRNASWVCLAVWLLALVGSTPQFANMEVRRLGTKTECIGKYGSQLEAWGSTIFRFLAGFLIPFAIICISHWMLYQKTGRGPCSEKRQKRRSARILRVILAVVLSFFLCYIPLHIVTIAAVAFRDTVIKSKLVLAHIVALCLAYLNSCINPLIYVCLGHTFRQSLVNSLRNVLNFASEETGRGLSITQTIRKHHSHKNRT